MSHLRPRGDYLLLIDASSFMHRMFHALPKLTRRSDGLQTGALNGFCNTMLKLYRLNWSPIGSLPRYGIVVLDHRSKNWRHTIYPEYKAQRPPYDPDLEAQLPWIKTIAETFGVPCLGMEGYEADDIIATYVMKAEEYGVDVVIASSDKDLGQLVWNDEAHMTIMYDSMKDKGPDDNAGALLGPAEITEKFGVPPLQIADFLSLTGDTVDNVPGVPGFGPKTAIRLLQEFGGLQQIIDEANWGPERFKQKEYEKIVDNMDAIKLSRRLVELHTEVPVELEIDDCYLKPVQSHVLRGLLMDLEFMNLLDKVDRPPRI